MSEAGGPVGKDRDGEKFAFMLREQQAMKAQVEQQGQLIRNQSALLEKLLIVQSDTKTAGAPAGRLARPGGAVASPKKASTKKGGVKTAATAATVVERVKKKVKKPLSQE